MMDMHLSARNRLGTAREHRRRHLVLLFIGGLLLLAMSPLFGHHLARGTAAIFAGGDHIGAVCLIAVHYRAEPVHCCSTSYSSPVLTSALWVRFAASNRVRRTLSVLPASVPAPDAEIATAASAAGSHRRR